MTKDCINEFLFFIKAADRYERIRTMVTTATNVLHLRSVVRVGGAFSLTVRAVLLPEDAHGSAGRVSNATRSACPYVIRPHVV